LFPLESEAVVPLDSSNFHQTSSPAASADPARPSSSMTAAMVAINFRCVFMVFLLVVGRFFGHWPNRKL
jgi:hypothetical protein